MVATVLLIRHARSTANDDPSVYKRVPDHIIPLARPQDDPAALAAGDAVARLGLDPASTGSWCSSYLRCQQTERLVLGRAFGERARRIRSRSSFLLREQEFGDWDSLSTEEVAALDPVRHARRQLLCDNVGQFYFRYPGGESRADVAQRVTIFIGKLFRSPQLHHIVFLHGVTQRAFRMSWLNLSVDWFEEEPNPENASVLLLERERPRSRRRLEIPGADDGRVDEEPAVGAGRPPRGRWRERYL
jgi:2,3-bisphosphoglycerate-dependent phosphoglycerate mutase